MGIFLIVKQLKCNVIALCSLAFFSYFQYCLLKFVGIWCGSPRTSFPEPYPHPLPHISSCLFYAYDVLCDLPRTILIWRYNFFTLYSCHEKNFIAFGFCAVVICLHLFVWVACHFLICEGRCDDVNGKGVRYAIFFHCYGMVSRYRMLSTFSGPRFGCNRSLYQWSVIQLKAAYSNTNCDEPSLNT